jgi:hypothetical protein
VRRLQLDSPWLKLAAVVLILVLAVMTRKAEAAFVCSSATMTTSTSTGSGTSCTNAQSNLGSTTLTQANNTCLSMGYDGACQTTVTYTTACTWNATLSKYQISGYRTFKCQTYVEPCPSCFQK